jgi:undecaprenyl-diphosphatase
MSLFQAIVLGIIQGLTEFLPISSSAHLIIFPHFFGWEKHNIAYDVFLHFGTLLSLILFFRKEIIEKFRNFKFLFFIILGSVPIAISGLLFKDFFESFFENIKFTGLFLIITGFILFSTKFAKEGNKEIDGINFLDVIFIGIAQSIGILPGISRSGITISSGILRGLKREFAFEFSFLLSIPAVLGANLLKFKDFLEAPPWIITYREIFTGVLSAGISGYLALFILSKIVKFKRLQIFSYYLWSVGILIFIFG